MKEILISACLIFLSGHSAGPQKEDVINKQNEINQFADNIRTIDSLKMDCKINHKVLDLRYKEIYSDTTKTVPTQK